MSLSHRLSALVTALGLVATLHAAPAPLIHLEATAVSPGPLTAWANVGTLGGVFTNIPAAAPRRELVAGRAAIVFSGSNWLQSDFESPAGLAGNHAFTLTVWVFNPDLKPKETLVSWASRPIHCAEFSYGNGRGRSEGAFTSYGTGNTGFDGSAPAAGTWHHLAWTYAGGSNGAFNIYVDGQLSTRRAFTLRTKPRQPVQIGTGWDSRANVRWTPFSGALAEVRIWDTELSEREVRNSAGWNDPFRPSPTDGVEVESRDTLFQWQGGTTNVAAFQFYLGTNAVDVAAATPQSDGVFQGNVNAGPAAWPVRILPLGSDYFWRIDQLDRRNELIGRGPIWRFRLGTGPAREPRPRDGLGAARPELTELRWQPGPFATAQTVWFGTNRDDVAGGRGQPMARLDGTARRVALPGALDKARHYYWRITTSNGDAVADAGPVWQFRTADPPRTNDVWFFVSSDTHYGFAENRQLNQQTIDLMNSAPGVRFPENFGGHAGTPRGVVLNGDLLDRGFDSEAPEYWSDWVRDYGLDGTDGRLGFPVYEGFGNHDGGPTKSVPRPAIRDRNRRRIGLSSISSNGLHYSWDWDHVHLVQLNLFGGDGPDDIQNVSKVEHNPEGALEFLKQDLARHVGASGRPVIVFQHFSWIGGMSDWWTPAAKDRFRRTVDGYHVAALINGHSHGASYIEWEGLPTIHNGATARPDSGGGDFLIVQVTTDELRFIQRKPGGWGTARRIPFAWKRSAAAR